MKKKKVHKYVPSNQKYLKVILLAIIHLVASCAAAIKIALPAKVPFVTSSTYIVIQSKELLDLYLTYNALLTLEVCKPSRPSTNVALCSDLDFKDFSREKEQVRFESIALRFAMDG